MNGVLETKCVARLRIVYVNIVWASLAVLGPTFHLNSCGCLFLVCLCAVLYLHSRPHLNENYTHLCCFSGEKRFKTIQDLVADSLITMYIDTYAKDYGDTMMISPVKSEEKKDERKTVDYETKENDETAEEAVTKPRPRVEAETDAVDVKEKRQVFFLTL